MQIRSENDENLTHDVDLEIGEFNAVLMGERGLACWGSSLGRLAGVHSLALHSYFNLIKFIVEKIPKKTS